MGKSNKEFYEQLMEDLDIDATVTILDEETTSQIFVGIEEDIQAFRAENQKRSQESHQEIQKVIFNS